MSLKDRGFASMDPAVRARIASLGGKAAHRKGTAHEWTVTEAAAAGAIGGSVTQKRKGASLPIRPAPDPVPEPAPEPEAPEKDEDDDDYEKADDAEEEDDPERGA